MVYEKFKSAQDAFIKFINQSKNETHVKKLERIWLISYRKNAFVLLINGISTFLGYLMQKPSF